MAVIAGRLAVTESGLSACFIFHARRKRPRHGYPSYVRPPLGPDRRRPDFADAQAAQFHRCDLPDSGRTDRPVRHGFSASPLKLHAAKHHAAYISPRCAKVTAGKIRSPLSLVFLHCTMAGPAHVFLYRISWNTHGCCVAMYGCSDSYYITEDGG